MEYFKENGYDLLAVIQVIGQGGAISHLRHQSVKKLINKKMIDVLVVPELRMISRSIPEVVQSLDYLKKFGIGVEVRAAILWSTQSFRFTVKLQTSLGRET